MPTYEPGSEGYPDPVCYDFTKYGLSAGEIPEPDDKKIRNFMRTLAEIGGGEGSLVALEGKPIVEQIAALLEVSETKQAEDAKKTNAAYAALCSNTPTAAEIAKVPWAPRLGFFKFVTRNFLVPELRAAVGSESTLNGNNSSTSSDQSSATP